MCKIDKKLTKGLDNLLYFKKRLTNVQIFCKFKIS
jgi:hypothetical protein